MPGNLTDYSEVKILEHLCGVNNFQMPGIVYLGLFTASPTDSGGGTEVSGGAYARQPVSWNDAQFGAGSITNAADITFPVASAPWGTIAAIAIFDAVAAGNMIWYGPTAQARTVGIGDVYKILQGSLTLSLD